MTEPDVAFEWLDRLIPRPQEFIVEGSEDFSRKQIALDLSRGQSSVLETVRQILSPFVRDEGHGEFIIRVASISEPNLQNTKQTLQALQQAPNADQAYAIEPMYDGDRFAGLLVVGNTSRGMLYGTRTLAQLLLRSAEDTEQITVPRVTIVDWPDIADRGQWGGDVRERVEETATLKLNVVEVIAEAFVDGDGKPRIRMDQAYIDRVRREGVKIVPYVSHLENVALRAGLMDRDDLTSTPDPTKPLPGEYVPGLCMSSPATVELAAAWMDEILRLDGVEDVEIWLSEARAPCFCDRCKGREPYELEVQCIVQAFERVRHIKPAARLWMLLTQGSYDVNDKVLVATPADVGVTYYDGGRTYDSSHTPMIYPLLEEYARSGRWLGVYPQITHAWRAVFPWTAPQFVHARAQEFADKGLRRVIGYAVPGNSFHAFNVAAWAEWTWNAGGRTVEELCRAYATRCGVADPVLYAEWAVKAGDAGWWLAESRLFLRAIYDPAIALREVVPTDFRFQQSDLLYERGQVEQAISVAGQALDLAYRLRDVDSAAGRDAVDETEAMLAGLTALLAIDTVRQLVHREVLSGKDQQALADALDQLDGAAATVSTRVARWGERVDVGARREDPFSGVGRLRDTANVLLRVGDAVRERAVELGIADPYAEHRLQDVGGWSASDFSEGRAELFFDVTNIASGSSGTWFVGFDFIEGDHGVIVEQLKVLLCDTTTDQTLVVNRFDGQVYVGRWERWHEVKVVLPADVRFDRATLEVVLAPRMLGDTLPDGWSSKGRVGLRRGWPEDIQALSTS